MEDVSNITKQALLNISKSSYDATPKIYEKEFCKIANEIEFDVEECKYFQYALSKISQSELKNALIGKIESIYDLIDILLQRVEKKNIKTMADLMAKSMQPSISIKLDEKLEAFSIKIGDSPSLIFEDAIQHEIEHFIEQRFEVDKKVLARKTADIARLITLMNKYLGDAIDTGKQGSSNILDIKNKISSLDVSASTQKELSTLQNKLVNAASNLESEIKTVNDNFTSGQNEIKELENRVKELEDELKRTKQTNKKDHLTGTLTRRAFEDELIKFDERFSRLGQDYAVVFFDIDHFKRINDNYGHDAGDVILKTFASLLIKLTRDIDIVGRYGGEEFISLVNYNNIDELFIYINRIKNIVNKNKFIYNEHKIQITFSAGVELRSNSNDPQSAILKADELLYKAKHTGRNRIILWDSKVI